MTRRKRKQAQVRSEPEASASKRSRRALALVLAVSVLGFAGWGGFRLLDPATFPVRRVQLTGTLEHVEPTQLRETVLPFAVAGLLRLNMDGVRAALEAMPWVHTASVRRRWPDVLWVALEEQSAIARWNDEGLVNPAGQLFSPPESEWPSRLPAFKGPKGSVGQLTTRYGVFRQLLVPLRLDVEVLRMDERRAWQLKLSNGMEVMLGRENAEARLERFVRVYPSALAARAADALRVDLRYTNGFSVAWRSSPQSGV